MIFSRGQHRALQNSHVYIILHVDSFPIVLRRKSPTKMLVNSLLSATQIDTTLARFGMLSGKLYFNSLKTAVKQIKQSNKLSSGV